MNNDSPPGSSRPTAGGEFTWPPTKDELDAIEVIPLDDTSSARQIAARQIAPQQIAANQIVTVPRVNVIARIRRWHPPRREDLVYLGVTVASALAISVATVQMLSDWRQASERAARLDAPVAPLAATSLPPTSPAAASSVADLALLRLLEQPPDVARAALAATAAPLTALAKGAAPTASPKVETRARRASRAAERRRLNTSASATYARRAANTPASGERRRRATAPGSASTSASRSTGAAAFATPPAPLSGDETRPRLISPERGRSGKVVLWVEVRKNGKVGDVDVLSSNLDRDNRSHRDLQRAAVSTVKRWRYTPAIRDGEPADTHVRVVVNIDLDSGAARAIGAPSEADARRRGAAANRVADSVRAAR